MNQRLQTIYDTHNHDCVGLTGEEVRTIMRILYDYESDAAAELHDKLASGLELDRDSADKALVIFVREIR